ncbi:LysR family transcriptional regulator [Serratia marcescens]|uniref:LysR family transcriptional regulator n=1 Tax=Serratia marcescens TaxID=615 RepID=A0A1Q4P5F0_SERMA|nr:LysR family transcriptional regulator [Serratia marcescens]OKB68350.1 LysR family transcriptional regulator [Serratia marcescens]
MFSSERLKGISLFVCVADMGSFTLAAERMNLTGSAVSKGIARLESRLQTRLFHRTTRRLSLTDAGAHFYRTCTGVLAELEEAELAIQAESAEPRGRVRIDLPASFGRLHALPAILRFIADHPLLVPHITFSDRFADPVSEGIDILVRIGGSDVWPNAVGHHYLGAQRHIFCAAPGYLKKHGEPTTADELAHHHCVLYQENDGVQTPWHFSGTGTQPVEKRMLAARVAIGDAEGQLTAVLAGHGIAQLPTWLVKRQVEAGTLVEVLPHLATDGLPINVVWLKSRRAQPKVSALLQALIAGLTPAGFAG